MIPELGHFALILALVLSVIISIIPLTGTFTGNMLWMNAGRSLAAGLFVFVALSFLFLTYAFVTDDFSVAYVSNNSNSKLPLPYKISAVWGGHEGSLLLWVLMQASWTLAVSVFSARLPTDMVARVLSVMGMVCVGFISFMLFTSNPFDRLLPNTPMEGRDLNPLLQDFGLIIHPPLLYLGYVGFSVAFAFAIAALLGGRLDAAWARWSRPWTNTAWLFLTAGIALGSWWAYYELGWGGWWFWDPVENASLMPWLAGTALVHSLAATEKRGVFKNWTLLLAIFAFSLSLLGTFLVRSGVLTSVHSFAADPARGMFILVFLAIVVGGSLTLYAFRAPTVVSKASYGLFSREIFILINNVLLVVACITVLLGTIYPLIMDALSLGKISVGPPYFNAVFVPLMCILLVLLAPGPMARWKQTSKSLLVQKLTVGLIASLVIGFAFPFLYHGDFNIVTVLTITLGCWVVAGIVRDVKEKTRHASSFGEGLKRLSASYYGMLLAHLGMAITAVGIGMTSQYSLERDIRLAPGDSVQLENHEFRFEGVTKEQGPNYIASRATFNISVDGEDRYRLYPEKRTYEARSNMMTEAAIEPGLFRDLYIAMGEPLEDGSDAWAVRIRYKPFVRWIWLGAIFMSVGGAVAIADKRYRMLRKVSVVHADPTADSQIVEQKAV